MSEFTAPHDDISADWDYVFPTLGTDAFSTRQRKRVGVMVQKCARYSLPRDLFLIVFYPALCIDRLISSGFFDQAFMPSDFSCNGNGR